MATRIPSETLLELYRRGLFPMDGPQGLQLFSPDPRGIIPLQEFHIPHGTAKTLRDPLWEVRVDFGFADVVLACAERGKTWINETIFTSYCELHAEGHAHSVEVWREGSLVGGLYGVRIGAAFFGESMFHRVTGASKVALCALVKRLCRGNFLLLDTQWVTPHLIGFGAVEIPRDDYMILLSKAVHADAEWLDDARDSIL